MAELNMFAKLAMESHNPAPFKVDVSETIYDQHRVNIVGDGVSVNLYLSMEQLEQVFGTINNYFESLSKVTA